ncbi:hypothetical protein B0H34DRAFT_61242 [Crassisporium funariophilum]|nr:hypothetical protein B0H34DRAFT_61242 [Crassisporium funariophilum]
MVREMEDKEPHLFHHTPSSNSKATLPTPLESNSPGRRRQSFRWLNDSIRNSPPLKDTAEVGDICSLLADSHLRKLSKDDWIDLSGLAAPSVTSLPASANLGDRDRKGGILRRIQEHIKMPLESHSSEKIARNVKKTIVDSAGAGELQDAEMLNPRQIFDGLIRRGWVAKLKKHKHGEVSTHVFRPII